MASANMGFIVLLKEIYANQLINNIRLQLRKVLLRITVLFYERMKEGNLNNPGITGKAFLKKYILSEVGISEKFKRFS